MDHSQHGQHNHHSTKDSAKSRAGKTEEQLQEKTLHGHEQAMHSDTRHHPPHDDHADHGHDHHRMMIDDFRKRFWISLILSIPVIVISPCPK